MRRRLYMAGVFTAAVFFLVFAHVSISGNRLRSPAQKTEPTSVSVTAVGPGPAETEAASAALLKHRLIRKYLENARHRLLSFEVIDAETKEDEHTVFSGRYRAILYDYTNNRMITAEGIFDDPRSVEVSVSHEQPLPSNEEFYAALDMLRKDPEFGPAIRRKKLIPYRPMPPVIEPSDHLSRVERTLTVGLRSLAGSRRRESIESNMIVGVNMVQRRVVRLGPADIRTSSVAAQVCGVPDAAQPTTSRSTSGLYKVTIKQGQTELWRFVAVRPSASSGLRGSGIELRDVRYRGKLVLKRAHVPILNVQYDNDACGPYRDWQWQEGTFQAVGSDVARGFRSTTARPSTVIESGDDTGNFRGVAVYTEGDETILVSELEAGWYRYISQWRFHTDGTIRPRFGLGGVQNGCICNAHTHHVYWRFDFDVVTAKNNVVFEESVMPQGVVAEPPFETEIRKLRSAADDRRWIVRNEVTGAGYLVRPGAHDGYADFFARGDLWVLRYRAAELDDGRSPYTTLNTEADLDKFVNGEPIARQDIVLWYTGHFRHDESIQNVEASHTGSDGGGGHHLEEGQAGDHIIGPDLIPVNW